MNLQQLEYFRTIASLGHMTKAAETLHVSQPTLSVALSNLESELSVPLFYKKGRRIELTHYGLAFHKHISVALDKISLAKEDIQRILRSEQNTIRISSTYSLGSTLLPDILKTFARENPNVTIQLQQGPNLDLIQNITRNATDFVFGRITPNLSEQETISYLPLFSEELVVLINKSNPLANNNSVDLETLKDEDFIFFHESTGFKTMVMELFEKACYMPKVKYEVYDNSACAGLVAANLGVALVSPLPQYDTSKINQLPLSSFSYKSDICLIWNTKSEQDASPIYHEFLSHIKRYAIAGT